MKTETRNFHRKVILFAAALLSGGSGIRAAAPADFQAWSKSIPREVPAVFPAEGMNEPGLRALFFENVPYRGKPTRVFAWYGVPKTGGPKFPAVVLVHGGGGTAFAEWVRLWNSRGYAAIAMDTYGGVPAKNATGSQRHSWPGPVGAMDTFEQIDEPIEDQWGYHGVAAVIRAHSLIRSFPEVDPARIGITGISWGGYLTSMAAGLDGRFACAAPVYGCGFFANDSGGFFDKLRSMGPRGEKWTALWDASNALSEARLPILWLNGTTDHWFPLPNWRKSHRLAPGTRSLTLRPHWAHNQSVGANAPEVGRFMDSILAGGKPLPRIVAQKAENDRLLLRWKSPLPIVEVELNYTANTGTFEKRQWQSKYLSFKTGGENIAAPIPPEATAYYCNIVDSEGMISSSDFVERTPTGPPPAVNGFVLLDEDFECRGVGIIPKGVTLTAERGTGAGITITDEAAVSGNRSLRFADAPGLAHDSDPMREFYPGGGRMDKGQVALSFQFRNPKAKPGHFLIEMRDMRNTPHRRGPRLEFMADGKLAAGGQQVATLPFDSWTRVIVKLSLDGQGGKTYQLTVTGDDGTGKTLDFPCDPEFAAVSWIGFMMPDNKAGTVYLDDVRFSCE